MRSRAGWFIRDGSTFISACGGTGNRERAEKRLASYITEKYQPVRERGRDPATVAIADAVSVYLTDVAPNHGPPAPLPFVRSMVMWGSFWVRLG